MSLIIYGHQNNPQTQFVLIVATKEGIDFQLSTIIPWDSKSKNELVTMFPLNGGKIPALEWADFRLTETLALAMYLAKRFNKTKLVGSGTLEEEALIISWMSWANTELWPALAAWYIPILPESAIPKDYKPEKPDFSVIRSSQATTLRLLDTLEDHLRARNFIASDHLTLADFIVTVIIARGLEWVLDAKWRGEHVNIIRNFDMVSRLAAFKTVIPEVILVEKALRIYDPDEMVSY